MQRDTLSLPELLEIASPMPPFIQELREKIRRGEKWQTRRPINPQPSAGVRESVFVKSGLEDGHGCELRPKYQDAIRYLREPLVRGTNGLAYYRDDHVVVLDGQGQYVKWRWKKEVLSQIFLPAELARSFFSWTVIGIQHIADITRDEIKAEGVRNTVDYGPILYDDFKHLWNWINAKRGFAFDANPYVWAYEFRAIQLKRGE